MADGPDLLGSACGLGCWTLDDGCGVEAPDARGVADSERATGSMLLSLPSVSSAIGLEGIESYCIKCFAEYKRTGPWMLSYHFDLHQSLAVVGGPYKGFRLVMLM